MSNVVDFTRNKGVGYAQLTKINPKKKGETFNIDLDLMFKIENDVDAKTVSKYAPGALEQYKSGKRADKTGTGTRRGLTSGNMRGRPADRDIILDLTDDSGIKIVGGDAVIQSIATGWDGEDFAYTIRVRFENLSATDIGNLYEILGGDFRLDYEARQLKTDGNGDGNTPDAENGLPIEKAA